jgi:hypothetical protein
MTLVLTFDEISILLYSRGYRQISGIKMPERDHTAPEIIYALKHMTDDGIVTAGEEAFRLRDDVAKIIDAIGNPVSVSMKESRNGHPAYSCYFTTGYVVVTQLHEFKERTLRITSFTEEEFVSWSEEIEDDYC